MATIGEHPRASESGSDIKDSSVHGHGGLHHRHIPHMAPIKDENEMVYKQEDRDRSEAIVQDQITGYGKSWELWACAFALAFSVTATYWNFIIPANSVPFIIASLGTSDNVSLFSIVWIMSIAVGIVVYGRLSDQFGRKPFTIGGLVLASVGSVVAGRAKNINTLVGAQVLIGLGAVPQIAYVLYCEMAPSRYKFLWLLPIFTVSIVPTGFGAVIGNAIARIDIEKETWRYSYYIAIAFNMTAAVILQFCYHPPNFRQIHGTHRTYWQELKRLDVIGLALLIPGATLFILGVSWGGQPSPWNSAKIVSLLVVGAFFLILFGLWEWLGKQKLPLVPLRIFRDVKGYPWLMVIGIVNRIVYQSVNIIWPGEVASIFYASELAAGRWHQAAWTTSLVGFGILSLLIIIAPIMDIIRHTKISMIVLSAWVVAFFGGLLCITPDKLAEGKAFAFLGMAPVGVLQDYVLVFAQMVCNEQEIGVVVCLMYFFQLFFSSVFTSVFVAILTNKLPAQITKYVSQAALANGFPEANLPQLITAALTAPATLSTVPGVSDQVLAAVGQAIPFAYSRAYRYVTAAGFSLTIVSLICCFFMPSYDPYFTDRVQRRVYTGAKDAHTDLLENNSMEKVSAEHHEAAALGRKQEV